MNLTGEQKRTIVAAYLGRTLDAFDFFVLTFVIKDIAKEFGVEVSSVAYAKGRKPTPCTTPRTRMWRRSPDRFGMSA